MLKNILKLNGVVKLKKEEQGSLNGGAWGRCSNAIICISNEDCGFGCQCTYNICGAGGGSH